MDLLGHPDDSVDVAGGHFTPGSHGSWLVHLVRGKGVRGGDFETDKTGVTIVRIPVEYHRDFEFECGMWSVLAQ